MFRIGVIIRNSWPISVAVEYAKLAEDLGFQSVWVNSTPTSRDPFVTLAAIAQETRRVRLGTAIVDCFTRHPAVLAGSIASMYELSGGRTDLGIAPGGYRSFMESIGIPWKNPVERTREATKIIKAFVAGQSVKFHGEIYSIENVKLKGKTDPNIRVFIAAAGPKMLKMTAEVADGLITPLLPPANTRILFQQYFDALKNANRSRWEVETIMEANVAVSDTREKAAELVRPYVAECIAHYTPPILEALNLTSEKAEFYRRNPSEVPDDLVRENAVCGTVDDCLTQIKQLKQQGLDEIYLWYPEFQNSKLTIDRMEERKHLMRLIGEKLIPLVRDI